MSAAKPKHRAAAAHPAAADLSDARKILAGWQALYALRGYELNRRLGGGFRVHLGGWSADFDSFEAICEFAIKAGIVHAAAMQ